MSTLLKRTLLIIGAIALVFPSGALAQGKEYKIFTIDEYVKMSNPDPGIAAGEKVLRFGRCESTDS